MAWYGSDGWDYYPPYISVAEKKAQGARALAKLLKRSKRSADPVVLAHRKRQLSATFWGQAWADNLERYADLANRLPRGRAYLRNGSVLDLAIGPGRVEAYVAGSELYQVTIGIAPLAKARWRRIVTHCTGRIGSLVGLLRGELSAEVLGVLTHARDGLFPEPRELALDCSCPDAANVCKHVAAVLYVVAIRLDTRPELFFDLRQVDQAELIGSGSASSSRTPRRSAWAAGSDGARRLREDLGGRQIYCQRLRTADSPGVCLPADSLDDLDQLLNGRRRPGDDEAVGGVVRDDPNPGRRDPPKGIRHFASQSMFEGDQPDGDGLRGESFGRNDPHAPGAADEPIPVQGENRLQELERLRRRDALRRKHGDLPFDLFRVEEERESRKPANVLDDCRELGVLEGERLRRGSPSQPRRAHDENA